MVTAVCSGMIVWFADTNEQLTAMKLLMKNESASETGWWMKMVINTGCFVPSSGLLLHAICQCVIATLHHSLTDTRAHTPIHQIFQLLGWYFMRKLLFIILRFRSVHIYLTQALNIRRWVKQDSATSGYDKHELDCTTWYTHKRVQKQHNTQDNLFSLNHDHFLFGRYWVFFVHEKSKNLKWRRWERGHDEKSDFVWNNINFTGISRLESALRYIAHRTYDRKSPWRNICDLLLKLLMTGQRCDVTNLALRKYLYGHGEQELQEELWVSQIAGRLLNSSFQAAVDREIVMNDIHFSGNERVRDMNGWGYEWG